MDKTLRFNMSLYKILFNSMNLQFNICPFQISKGN